MRIFLYDEYAVALTNGEMASVSTYEEGKRYGSIQRQVMRRQVFVEPPESGPWVYLYGPWEPT